MIDIFVSYQWDVADLVHKIADKLQYKSKFSVWIDKNKMRVGDSLYKEMENGIHKSKLFLAFITKKYCESVNCKFEIQYANSLRGSNSKKCIYVILEDDLGKDLDGVGLLIAGSIRLNAYEEHNCKSEWSEKLFEKLENSIKFHLFNEPSTTHINDFVSDVDLEELITCNVCKEKFNLQNEEEITCAKPKIINLHCNKIICLKCIKQRMVSSDSAFICPYDNNEHLICNLTNATRIHRVIKYIDTNKTVSVFKEFYDKYENNIKNILEDTEEELRRTKLEIEKKVNTVITQLLDYKDVMVRKLDESFEKFKLQIEENNETLKLNETSSWLDSSETTLKSIEQQLKQLENIISTKSSDSCEIDKLINSVDGNINNIKETVQTYTENLQKSNQFLNRKLDVTYKKSVNQIDLCDIVGRIVEKTDWLKCSIAFSESIKIQNSEYLMSICDFETNGHLTLSDSLNKCLYVLDRYNFNHIKTIWLNCSIGEQCALNNKGLLCVVDEDNYYLFMLNKSYETINKKKLDIKMDKHGKESKYRAVECNEVNESLYLIDCVTHRILKFDSDLNLINEKELCFARNYDSSGIYSLKILNDQIYICDSGYGKCVHLLDEQLNLITSFANDSNHWLPNTTDHTTIERNLLDTINYSLTDDKNNQEFIILCAGEPDNIIKVFNLNGEFLRDVRIQTKFNKFSTSSIIIIENKIIVVDNKAINIFNINNQ